MPRIFACVVTGQLIVLLAAAAFGLFKWDPTVGRHVILAVFALILCCLIQVVAFTYLTITGKMIVQAVHLGGLSTDSLQRAAAIKRSMTRAVGAAVLGIVIVTSTGAYHWRAGSSLPYHLPAACLAIAGQVGSAIFQYTLIARNAALVRSVLADYSRQKERSALVDRATPNSFP